ncbi:MAG: acylphosphatase [Chloroflexi bacterium]|nr:acylphosphatase [Chloroflexota bacterium]
MSAHKRLRAVVRGRVQGVGFRYSTLRRAISLELRGWVANRSDGSVEVVAEGNHVALETLLDFLHRGPPAADVHEVDLRWDVAVGEFSTFNMR